MAELNGKKILFSPHVHISGTDTSDATATAADIVTGKTAYARGVKLTGTAKSEQQVYAEMNSKTFGGV